MSKQSAPSAEAFNEWRKGVVGEWFFDTYLEQMRENLKESWAGAMDARPDVLLGFQSRLKERDDIFATLQQRDHKTICSDLDMEASDA